MKKSNVLTVIGLLWASPSFAATAVEATAPDPAAPPVSTEYCQTQWQVNGHCDFNNDAPFSLTNPTRENYTCSEDAGGVPATKNATCTISYGIPPTNINDSRSIADNYCAMKRPTNMTDALQVKRYLNQIKCSYKASKEMLGDREGTYQCVPAKSLKDPSWNGEKCASKK